MNWGRHLYSKVTGELNRTFKVALIALSMIAATRAHSETVALEADVVELIFCYSENDDINFCSQNFIDSCLGSKVSSVEFPGVEKNCLENLVTAWGVVQSGLVKRGQANYQNSQRYLYKNLLETQTKYDEAFCAFESGKIPSNIRDIDLLYCRLGKAIDRIEFIKSDHQSAQIEDQTRSETLPQTGIR